jgi:hypothetical protein
MCDFVEGVGRVTAAGPNRQGGLTTEYVIVVEDVASTVTAAAPALIAVSAQFSCSARAHASSFVIVEAVAN